MLTIHTVAGGCLQNVAVALGSWHLFMGMCAYILADRAGEPWLKPTAKVTIGTASWPLLQCCSTDFPFRSPVLLPVLCRLC